MIKQLIYFHTLTPLTIVHLIFLSKNAPSRKQNQKNFKLVRNLVWNVLLIAPDNNAAFCTKISSFYP